MRSWNSKLQKYKARVVLREDIVKDDSGAYAVFSEQGASASQMTAAEIIDVIAISPGCDGQCNICAYSGKIGGCSQIARKSKFGMSRCLDASSTTQMSEIT